MGTWGIQPFENDAAADWVYELEDSGVAAVNAALDLSKAEYLDGSDGETIIAAAEVVAAAFGSPGTGLPDSVGTALAAHGKAIQSDTALKDKAKRAVDRVLAGESELLETWGDADDFETWRESAKALSRRLTAT